MEAESYSDDATASFIHDNFVPVEAHIKEHPAWFKRFEAIWTPTVLVLDDEGTERWRIEGYLPRQEFRAELEMALARLDALEKRWENAGARYQAIVDAYGATKRAPEALYWRYVSEYSRTHDHTILAEAERALRERYPDSREAVKASVWAA